MNKKWSLLVVFILIFFSLFVSTHFVNATHSNIIYVDDDNTMGPWEGTLEHPYQYIQDGIDAAKNDDIVFVYSGVYYENLVIENSFHSLEGQDRNTTIINGSGRDDVICVMVDDLVIREFTITKCGHNYMDDAGIDVQSSRRTLIYSCNFYDAHNGIILNQGEGNGIWYNIFENCRDNTILLMRTHKNVLSGNYISGEHNIGCYFIGSCFNTITENTFRGHHFNHASSSIAIWICGGLQNEIYRNNITNYNGGGGSKSLTFEGSHLNKIKENNFIFDEDPFFWNCVHNSWSQNYWHGLTKPIKIVYGQIQLFLLHYLIPFMPLHIRYYAVDWHPANEAYIIPRSIY